MRVKLRQHFDAAHRLPGYDGPCANLHGHRWEMVVTIEGPITRGGMVIDFKELKAVLSAILPDHQYINEAWPDVPVPTAERIAERIGELLVLNIAERHCRVVEVEVFESPEASAVWLP